MCRKKIILISSLALILLTGCAEAPNNHNRKTEVTNTKEDNDKMQGIEMDSIENVLSEADNVKKLSFDNLYYAQDFEINKPEAIKKIEFKQTSDYHKEGMKIIRNFIKDLNPNIQIDTDLDKPGMQYIDDENRNSFAVSTNGSIYFDNEQGFAWPGVLNGGTSKFKPIEKVCIDSGYENKEYAWNNKNLTLNDIVETAQKEADEFCKKYDALKWRPQQIDVYQDDDGQYFFQVNYVKQFQGMDMFYEDYRKGLQYVKAAYVSVMRPFMVFNSSKEVIALDNYPGIIEYNQDIKQYDKIVTLECASKLLSDKLSSYKAYNVYYVKLEYRLQKTSGEKVAADMMYVNWEAGNTYETMPCWTFYMSNDLNHDMTFAMVDCITGDVEFISGE